MIMRQDYLEDLKEQLVRLPQEYFRLTREQIMEDKNGMEKLWIIYQKDIEDYACDPEYACQDALLEVYGIPMNSIDAITNTMLAQWISVEQRNCKFR